MLIVIDDIDRLNTSQICRIFQLVASVADFPNTMYLLIFDKEIVVRSLEEVQKGRGEDYLEKIIQMPINIPDVSDAKLKGLFLERLNDIAERHSDSYYKSIFRNCILHV